MGANAVFSSFMFRDWDSIGGGGEGVDELSNVACKHFNRKFYIDSTERAFWHG